MSPEVLRGGGYGWKSDVWSLGCMLYELAMLRSPFKGEGLNLYSLFKKITNVRGKQTVAERGIEDDRDKLYLVLLMLCCPPADGVEIKAQAPINPTY